MDFVGIVTLTLTINMKDEEGRWEVGAMTALMDNVGAAAVSSFGQIKISVDFNVSFYSTAKIHVKFSFWRQFYDFVSFMRLC